MSSVRLFAFFLAIFSSMLWSGCVNDEQGSLFNPNATFAPAPTITSITPSAGAQAGVDTLTITGTNYLPNSQNTFAYFNSTVANLLQLSTTQLVLKAPFVLGDSVRVRIGVQGADQLSNLFYYKLTAAIQAFGNLAPQEFARAIGTDASGNVYVSLASGSGDIGVRRFTSAGDTTNFAPGTALVAQWSSLKRGPAGYIYAVRGSRGIFRYNPTGGNSLDSAWILFELPSSARITDIDFDANQNLWAVGSLSGNAVFSIKQDKTVKSMPFTGTVRSVRVFGSYLYLSALKNNEEGIWRVPLIGDSIGVEEKYFDFGAAYPGKAVQGITFSASGALYIATAAPEGLVIVTPSKTASAPYVAYTTLIGTSLKALAWGSADALYATSAEGVLARINTRTTGAPYYGQQF